MIIYLRDFFLKGVFGPIHIGTDKTVVKSLLGKPTFEGDLNEGSAILYGAYELFFSEKEVLYAIQNDSLEFKNCIHFKNQNFVVDTWFLSPEKKCTFELVKGILIKENINFSLVKSLTDSPSPFTIKLESEVTMDFTRNDHSDNDGDRHAELFAIRYFTDL